MTAAVFRQTLGNCQGGIGCREVEDPAGKTQGTSANRTRDVSL